MDDFDIEMGDAADVQPMHEPEPIDILNEEEQEPGEVEEPITSGPAETESPDERRPVPNKVHIRGLESINADELKQYVGQNAGGSALERIEWIDDSSANLVFGSDSAAQDALVALAAVEIADASQLPPLEGLPAKPFAAKPETALQVRFAVVADKKQSGAAARSRFYLLNPEWDPEERRRREGNRRYRDRDGDRGYGRDRRGGGRGRRDDRYDDDDEPEPFDVNLYDDDAEALAKRAPVRRSRRGSRSPSPRSDSGRYRSYASQNKEKELFPDKRVRDRDRNRSASPLRDNDVDQAMDDLAKDREAVARNREKARSLKERITKTDSNGARELFPSKVDNNGPKELFPSKVGAADAKKAQMDQVASDSPTSGINIRGIAGQRGGASQGFAIKGAAASARELFPDKFSSNAGKELFVEKLEGRGRRRQKAEDSFY
ncbi:DUF2414 domain protein [Pleurostoma richardsiae]|uniref:DUF2414 domain protein n=1 Tax=Pleurostoma richardsiae TaxID=41990 RepID=A0AA38RCA5_9PEZI|nr:DUF2414 domain protein [Pleurostoma richardsiae]